MVLSNCPANAKVHQDKPTAGKTYEYRVIAVNGNGQSGASNIVRITVTKTRMSAGATAILAAPEAGAEIPPDSTVETPPVEPGADGTAPEPVLGVPAPETGTGAPAPQPTVDTPKEKKPKKAKKGKKAKKPKKGKKGKKAKKPTKAKQGKPALRSVGKQKKKR